MSNAQAQEYRRKAEEAEQTASEVRDLGIKNSYCEIAKRWRAMADYAENRERLAGRVDFN